MKKHNAQKIIVSVIIPFYQRSKGVLRRCLISILKQEIDDFSVEILIVNDESPCNPDDEIHNLNYYQKDFKISILHQKNTGVGGARNKGLESINPNSSLIAFIDSDDEWETAHLKSGVNLYKQGYDLIFTDIKRHDSATSDLNSEWKKIFQNTFSEEIRSKNDIIISKEELIILNLQEFITHVPAIIYSATDATKHIRFNTELKSAGEDNLFIFDLAKASSNPILSMRTTVQCGSGVNIYQSNSGWDSNNYLMVKANQFICYRLIAQRTKGEENHIAQRKAAYYKSHLSFHILRNILTSPKKVVIALKFIAKNRPLELITIPFYAFISAVRYAIDKEYFY